MHTTCTIYKSTQYVCLNAWETFINLKFNLCKLEKDWRISISNKDVWAHLICIYTKVTYVISTARKKCQTEYYTNKNWQITIQNAI